jgi:cell division transport system permease protein
VSAGRSRKSLPFPLRRSIDTVVGMPRVTGVTLTALLVSVLFAGAIVLVSSNAWRLTALWATAGIDVSIYLDTEAAEDAVVALEGQLGSDPAVLEVRFVSRDEAWQFLAENLSDSPTLLDGLAASVLPASFELRMDPQLDPAALEDRVDVWRGLAAVSDVQHNRYRAGRRAASLDVVGLVAWALGALALLASAMIVATTFQLAVYTQRDELDVLRLMGAVGTSYWGPVVLAGVAQGLFAAAVALAMLWGAYLAVAATVVAELPLVAEGLAFLGVGQLGALLVWGALLGAAGSLLGLWRAAQWH